MNKKSLLPVVSMSLLAMSMWSCGEDVASGSDGKGFIRPSVAVDAGFLGVEVTSKASGDIEVGDLSMTVTSADGSYTHTWESVNDFNADEQFPIGDYTVEVAYADREAEGFECEAAYHDSQDIHVIEGAATPVSLTAARTHALVTVAYTDAFKNYLRRATVDVVSAAGKTHHFAYSEAYTEERSALINPGKTQVVVELEKLTGTTAKGIKVAEFAAEARHHYTVTVDVNSGGVGDATLTVSFDDSVEAETIDVDLSDELLAAPAPEVTVEGVEDGGQLEFVETLFDGAPVRVSIIARGGVASVRLATASTYFRDRCSWPADVELVALSESDRSRYTNAGLDCKGLWGTTGRMAVIDFTKALQKMIYFDADNVYNNVSTFTITVTDCNGKTAEMPVSFSAKVDKMQLALDNPSDVKIFDTEASFDLTFNGSNPETNVRFTRLNDRGASVAADVKSIEKTGDNLYHVTLQNLPSDIKDITVTATCNTKSASLKVLRKGVVLSAIANDVFATRAYVSLTPVNIEADKFDGMSFVLASEGDRALTYTRQADNYYLVSGLTPGVDNSIELVLTDNTVYCTPLTVAAELAAQIPNGDFEEEATVVASASNWENYSFAGWGTNNTLTTSDGANNAYCRISGTKPEANGKQGKGIRISTQGWGSGNTAGASFGTSICNKIDAGLLHLGSNRAERPSGYSDRSGSLTTDDLDCGIDFSSRPSELSFWYKYEAKNSADYGTAKVEVLDASGNVIASGSLELGSQADYVQKTVNLTYAPGAPKAAKIYVRFMSTGVSTALTKNESWLVKPPFANLSRGEWYGSRLYIDEVQLAY